MGKVQKRKKPEPTVRTKLVKSLKEDRKKLRTKLRQAERDLKSLGAIKRKNK